MKKSTKKLVTLLFALALMAGCLFMTTEAKASVAGPEKTDAKNGILWNSAMRIDLYNKDNRCAEFYFSNPDYYVASVKSSSKNLIVKMTEDYYPTSYILRRDDKTGTEYRRRCSVEFFTKKKGNYTVTVTIKNAKKKVVTKKKVKVFAGYSDYAVNTVTYAGATYYSFGNGTNFLTSTKSGKLKLKANPTFKIKKIEVATKYNENGDPIYKKIKNGAKIKLATKTTFEKIWYESDTYRTACKYNFLKPMTKIRVTYRDTKFKVTKTEEYSIFNVK